MLRPLQATICALLCGLPAVASGQATQLAKGVRAAVDLLGKGAPAR